MNDYIYLLNFKGGKKEKTDEEIQKEVDENNKIWTLDKYYNNLKKNKFGIL